MLRRQEDLHLKPGSAALQLCDHGRFIYLPGPRFLNCKMEMIPVSQCCDASRRSHGQAAWCTAETQQDISPLLREVSDVIRRKATTG